MKAHTRKPNSNKISKWKTEMITVNVSLTLKCIKHSEKWNDSFLSLAFSHSVGVLRLMKWVFAKIVNWNRNKVKLILQICVCFLLSNFLLHQFLANRLQNWVWQFSFYVRYKWQLGGCWWWWWGWFSISLSVYVFAIPSSSSSSWCDGRMDGFMVSFICSCNSFTLQSTISNVAKRIPKHSVSWFIITYTQTRRKQKREETKIRGRKEKLKYSNHRYFTHSTMCQTKMFNMQ